VRAYAGHPGADPHAHRLRGHDLPQRDAAVPGPAHVRADGASPPRRGAGGLEHRHGVLPGRPSRGVRLRACDDRVARPAAPARPPRDGPLPAPAGPSDRRALGVDATGPGESHPLAPDRADGRRRLALLRGLHQRAPPAEVVRGDRPPGGRRSLLPLRGQQPGQHAGAPELPFARRAVPAPGPAEPALDGGLRPARRADPGRPSSGAPPPGGRCRRWRARPMRRCPGPRQPSPPGAGCAGCSCRSYPRASCWG